MYFFNEITRDDSNKKKKKKKREGSEREVGFPITRSNALVPSLRTL